VIRRGFWLTVGAVTGIVGYRRVCATAQRISASRGVGDTIRFARDVRDGMELYRVAHPAPGRPTLTTDTTDHDTRPEDGR
jgi:hypothetical protein